jgi:two-component system sensor histidine kinase PhoQ
MKRPQSLGRQVLTAATLLLVFFFGLAFAALDVAFGRAARSSLEEVLHSQVLALLAAADPAEGHMLVMPKGLPESRFSRPGSGLYGRLIDGQDETVWVSDSAVGLRLPGRLPVDTGRITFEEVTMADGVKLLSAALRIEWEFDDGRLEPFVFAVSSSLDGLDAQVGRFRTWLGGGFALLVMILLGAQFLVLRFLLRPLGKAEKEVREIEAGSRPRLSSGYPAEIEALSGSVNTLIESERARSKRYRESLDNLAHSLKTPIAVVRSQLDSRKDEDSGVVSEQLDRMQSIVEYQLNRAAVHGSTLGQAPTAVAPVAESILDALGKVYRDREIQVSAELDAAAAFPGDRGDLAELLGNVLDNAFKYGRARVNLGIRVALAVDGWPGEGLGLEVDDDGPGLLPEKAGELLRRGARGDDSAPGQGIGLSVVADIVRSYGGELSLGRSALGGAKARIFIPATGSDPDSSD